MSRRTFGGSASNASSDGSVFGVDVAFLVLAVVGADQWRVLLNAGVLIPAFLRFDGSLVTVVVLLGVGRAHLLLAAFVPKGTLKLSASNDNWLASIITESVFRALVDWVVF